MTARNPIREFRKRHEMTQRELAESLGMSERVICAKESGHRPVRKVDKMALRELERVITETGGTGNAET